MFSAYLSQHCHTSNKFISFYYSIFLSILVDFNTQIFVILWYFFVILEIVQDYVLCIDVQQCVYFTTGWHKALTFLFEFLNLVSTFIKQRVDIQHPCLSLLVIFATFSVGLIFCIVFNSIIIFHTFTICLLWWIPKQSVSYCYSTFCKLLFRNCRYERVCSTTSVTSFFLCFINALSSSSSDNVNIKIKVSHFSSMSISCFCSVFFRSNTNLLHCNQMKNEVKYVPIVFRKNIRETKCIIWEKNWKTDRLVFLQLIFDSLRIYLVSAAAIIVIKTCAKLPIITFMFKKVIDITILCLWNRNLC